MTEESSNHGDLTEESWSKSSLYWINKIRMEEHRPVPEMQPESPIWTNQELHLFIVTDAGKPVYSRYGTVQKLNPILCTCVAILGHMEALHEELNHFRAGAHTFVFLPKKPFVFIAVSKSSLPVSYLFKQLNFLYSLFLSLFSETLINQLNQRPQCDFRQIAEGTKPAWDGVVNNMSEDPAFIFAPSVPVGIIDPEDRQKITKYLAKLPPSKLSMLMYRNRVLAVGNCMCDSLTLRLIIDLIWTPSYSAPAGIFSTPFFPRDSSYGMHHIYINKLENTDYSIIMLCNDAQNYKASSGPPNKFYSELKSILLKPVEKPFTWTPSIFYFWALHSFAHGQVFVTDPRPDAFDSPDPQESIIKMQDLCRQLAKSCDMVETNGVEGEYMFRGEKEVIVVLRTSSIELYAVTNSKDLKNEEISGKLAELRAYINAHFNDLILTEYKFPVVRFT